jgi:hypothetical protein
MSAGAFRPDEPKASPSPKRGLRSSCSSGKGGPFIGIDGNPPLPGYVYRTGYTPALMAFIPYFTNVNNII